MIVYWLIYHRFKVSAQEQECIISGYLVTMKKKKQKKRWFVLKEHALYSYKAPSVSLIYMVLSKPFSDVSNDLCSVLAKMFIRKILETANELLSHIFWFAMHQLKASQFLSGSMGLCSSIPWLKPNQFLVWITSGKPYLYIFKYIIALYGQSCKRDLSYLKDLEFISGLGILWTIPTTIPGIFDKQPTKVIVLNLSY